MRLGLVALLRRPSLIHLFPSWEHLYCSITCFACIVYSLGSYSTCFLGLGPRYSQYSSHNYCTGSVDWNCSWLCLECFTSYAERESKASGMKAARALGLHECQADPYCMMYHWYPGHHLLVCFNSLISTVITAFCHIAMSYYPSHHFLAYLLMRWRAYYVSSP